MPPTNKHSQRPPWLRAASFLALVLAVLFGLSKFFDHAARQNLREKAHWVISQRSESFDFAIMGASRPYVGVHIPTLEHKLGTKGVNLALDGTTYPEQYLALTLFLEHNHIKQLILDVSVAGFDNTAFKFPFRAYQYLPWINDPVVFHQLRDYFGWRACAWKYVPFFKNAEFNSKIAAVQRFTFVTSAFEVAPEFDQDGTFLIDRKFDEVDLENHPSASFQVETMLQKYLLRLLELAKKNQIEVTMIMMPEYHEYIARQSNRQEIIDFYTAVAASNSMPFLRFDQDAICLDKTKFYNKNHLNRSGAMVFSESLGGRLASQNVPRALPYNR